MKIRNFKILCVYSILSVPAGMLIVCKVQAASAKMFRTQEGMVRRADLDGSNVETLVPAWQIRFYFTVRRATPPIIQSIGKI